MSMITEFMNQVKKYAVFRNIDFILVTNEGTVSNGSVINNDTVKEKEPEKLPEHNPDFKDLAKICRHLYDQELSVALLNGSPLDTSIEPAVYIKIDMKRDKYYIMIIYKGKSYDLFEIVWYLSGYKPTLDNYKIGIMSTRIMNKEYSFIITSEIEELSIIKECNYENIDHEEWCIIVDYIIEAIKYSVNGFRNIGLFG